MTVHLTVAEVIAIHADLIARYGGSPGLRDQGRLEAAVFRPRSGYYPDLIAEAAALTVREEQTASNGRVPKPGRGRAA